MEFRIVIAFLLLSAFLRAAEITDSPPQPSRKLFWAEVAAYTAANIADGVSTVRYIEAFSNGRETESSWLYGRRPTYASYFVPALALEGAQGFFSHRFQHSPHVWLRVIGQSIMLIETADHTKGALHNIRLLSGPLAPPGFKAIRMTRSQPKP